MAKRKPYLNNKEFTARITEYAIAFNAAIEEHGSEEAAFKKVKMSDELAKNLMLMVSRLASRSGFAFYPFREDMEAEAIMEAFRKCHKFDYTRFDNGFAYMTMIIKCSFVNRIRKEKEIATGLDSFIMEMSGDDSPLQVETMKLFVEEKRGLEEKMYNPRIKTGFTLRNPRVVVKKEVIEKIKKFTLFDL